MSRIRIGVLFGGASEEHPVSVKSAREVARNLDPDRYEAHWIGITRDGAWRLCAGPENDWESGSVPAMLSPDRGDHGLLVREAGRYRVVELDVILPVLHGRFGEDGAVQGLCELSGVDYIGCDVPSSAICMDKSLAYVISSAAGIATPEFRIVAGHEAPDPAELAYPVFVKPARSGSSFGVSKVTAPDDLPAAIEAAREYDSKVLIERAVAGSEVGCAVLGDGRGLTVGEVDHIALSHGFFRIHQEDSPETGSENSTPIVPADIPAESRARVQQTARAIYRALGCSGLARVDMFLTPGGEVVLNEVNTLPGLTSYSRYPRMMSAAGISLAEVLDRLVCLTRTGGS
ncbi:D-alanine--D-alanine ligase OS=Tsukamurella paurometabola (strain ATCC 8368 / DSM / CCUG 35730/ CIP 100753 / JCM 10117 / KCTC 9821 / NBRC 16120 / NCIMB 702349 / NCTC 13040) OX=521096 GN=ddl PE=3 SV=1 [Tsukamurella paurometabola]|uniref:D-alanine--D-alanine ligase n=1 Tax=Tsukamurella paurometabola (strain ATCC 8368 / DSM 20162 / CCUG 35730 / CIP 100753 / JCM 10117 / KCTC 9821 / NBRC 16120 / NCIMB 702349 / NCTC 13040) TaxID=521096 RepID=D5US97_TSUPD|nr:D-alanine--(R)-lactate ligase [Tsukamurella paurometabola]ADG77164.1 D-alanine/D-alanine ligase [Tsukamurella paurometabola DSM 20162]SUP43005.1 Vancomycin B-type resistance protein VanB [Tsukamurella paurometabola]